MVWRILYGDWGFTVDSNKNVIKTAHNKNLRTHERVEKEKETNRISPFPTQQLLKIAE